MGKDKKHVKKKEAPFKTHSRRTGKIILAVLALLVVSSGSFLYLAMDENQRQEKEIEEFRLLACDEMKENILSDPVEWKRIALYDKQDSGGCD